MWTTPRASWHTTSDGYIQRQHLGELYGKITKNRNYDKNYDKILTATDKEKVMTYSSQVTLSYNNTKVRRKTVPATLSDQRNIGGFLRSYIESNGIAGLFTVKVIS